MIKVEKLGVAFNGQTILNNFSLLLPNRGLFILTGRSGCGKTTLLKLLSGRFDVTLAKVTGRITIEDAPPKQQQSLISYQEQENHFLEFLNAGDNVLTGRSRRIEKWIKDLDVHHLVGQPIRNLSQGEKARVALIRTLATSAPILLLDEPLAALNGELVEVVMAILNEESKHRLILISSHIAPEGTRQIEVASDRKYRFEDDNATDTKREKTRNNPKIDYQLIGRQIRHILPSLISMSALATIGIIFMTLGVVLGQATENSFQAAIKRDYLHHALVKAPTISLSATQEGQARALLGTREVRSLPLFEHRFQMLHNNQAVTVEALLGEAEQFELWVPKGFPLALDCPFLVDGVQINMSYQIKEYEGRQLLLKGELADFVNRIGQALDSVKYQMVTSYQTATPLDQEVVEQLTTTQIGTTILARADLIYYQLYNADQAIWHHLGDSMMVYGNLQVSLEKITIHDEDQGEIEVRVGGDQTVKVSRGLGVESTLQLRLSYYDLLEGEKEERVSLLVDQVEEGEEKYIIVPHSLFELLGVGQVATNYRLVFFNNQEIEAISQLRDEYQVQSLPLEVADVFADMARFINFTFIAIALFFWAVGLLVLVLAGNYLYHRLSPNYQLLHLLGYKTSQVIILYGANFLILSLIGLVSSGAFLFLLAQGGSLAGETMNIAIGQSVIEFSIFEAISVNQGHYLLLILLSLVIPLLAFIINTMIIFPKFRPQV